MFKPSKIEFENFCNELFETKKDMALEIMKVVLVWGIYYPILNIGTTLHTLLRCRRLLSVHSLST